MKFCPLLDNGLQLEIKMLSKLSQFQDGKIRWKNLKFVGS